ncbi:adenine-specific methyltransferase EcoRI family protein [Patescibacteria group bacterium]
MAKSLNANLHRAAKAKNDEFYTLLPDIERELKHYKDQFHDKIIYCNCDDPFESNFFKYFAANFNALRLKKLITTSYVKSPIVGGQLPLFEVEGLKPSGKEPFKIEIKKVPDVDGDGAINLDDVKYLLKHDKNIATPLKGVGDFRSDECVEFLKQADVVVTNPPFSLFREYIEQLVEYDKNFLIIGNDNARTYKEIFRLIQKNKLWAGYEKVREFMQPDKTIKKFGNVGWFTNLDVAKRHEFLTLYKKYTSQEFPKYDNYDAIEVSKVSEIPMDYKGVMGVPITFFDKYNPKQFEILGITDRDPNNKLRTKLYTRKDSPNYNDLNRRAAIRINKNIQPTYARLLIKSKN